MRTGLKHLTIVDDDIVAPSNINRQAPATSRTIGRAKVDAFKVRLTEINEEVEITALNVRYMPESTIFTVDYLKKFDFIVDAIDSITDKAHLIRTATGNNLSLFSSMGAALRTSPTLVRTAPFDKVSGDKLAKALRNRFRHDEVGTIPSFPCVYSLEAPMQCSELGSLMPVTATFGVTLAAEVISRI